MPRPILPGPDKTGMVLALQGAIQLEPYGAVQYISRLISTSVVRELGPVLAALMIAGRVGSGIASELASMQVTEQIDALRAEGTDPIKKLVTPRLVASVIMVPVLTVITNGIALLGGFVIAHFYLRDRKSTRLNSSHLVISYAVFCLKKKK